LNAKAGGVSKKPDAPPAFNRIHLILLFTEELFQAFQLLFVTQNDETRTWFHHHLWSWIDLVRPIWFFISNNICPRYFSDVELPQWLTTIAFRQRFKRNFFEANVRTILISDIGKKIRLLQADSLMSPYKSLQSAQALLHDPHLTFAAF
jgi:hypothetical protein